MLKHPNEARTQLLATVTGELSQPVRIYFNVPDKNAVNKKFRSLKCMQSDLVRKRWTWLFEGEAKKLEFDKGYAEIPKKLRPIIIGSFYFRPPAEMYLDVRSIERAIHAITFFDRLLGRKIAEMTEFSVVNRLLSATEYQVDFKHFFKEEVRLSPDHLLDQLKSNPLEALQLLGQEMDKPEPEVVRMPLNYYSDGIEGIKSALRMRQYVALEKWKGNAVSSKDVFERIFGQLSQPSTLPSGKQDQSL
ncbi:hypothetical protein G3480_20720 [Thiorhodococcus mannitoliphagus]|uniref:Uncharacterized protein n=1 Tax=Thiorhodococcus mannitoliphagus TaxID=329406 RepID=A0A6P1DYZ3_9GAMM|nr:hypothetical protein [Thiorhodococcus mannitoliphagus]NEX22700.1 hypothetical protein [Thiorhodococcus mannitoliphagus]